MRSLVFAAAISGSIALFQLGAETISYSAVASDSAACFIVNQQSGNTVYEGGAADRNCQNYKPGLGVQGPLAPGDYVTARLDWTRRDATDGGDIYEFSISADVFYAVRLPDPVMTVPEETRVRLNLERSIAFPFILPGAGVGVLQSPGQAFTSSSGGLQALAHVDFPDLLFPGVESMFTITISPDVVLTFSRPGVAGGGGILGLEYYVAPAGPGDVPTPEPGTGLVTVAGALLIAVGSRRRKVCARE